jgi:DNA repair protein RadA/Sms
MECCFTGEVGLTGEIRPVTRTEQRLAEAAKLGFSRMFIPKGSKGIPTDPGIEVVPVGRVEEVLAELFG